MTRPRGWWVLRIGIVSLVLAAMLAGPAHARTDESDDEEPPPPPGVTFEHSKGYRQARVILPGRLISYALPSGADGKRVLHALLAPAPPAKPMAEQEVEEELREVGISVRIIPDGQSPSLVKAEPMPRILVRIEMEGDAEIVILADDLSPKATSIDSMDIDESLRIRFARIG